MMLMFRMAKPLWGSRNELIMGSVLFLFKGLLVCLREGSMEVNWTRRIDIGQNKFMDMKSMPIVK